MKRNQILGLLIGASLLIGYEPVAEAIPAAAPASAVEMSASTGVVVQARVYHGAARRTTRRHVRRRVR